MSPLRSGLCFTRKTKNSTRLSLLKQHLTLNGAQSDGKAARSGFAGLRAAQPTSPLGPRVRPTAAPHHRSRSARRCSAISCHGGGSTPRRGRTDHAPSQETSPWLWSQPRLACLFHTLDDL